MALIALPMLIQPEKNQKNVSAIKHFKSRGDQDFFTCVEYSPSAERLVTGGTDGLLRLVLANSTIGKCLGRGTDVFKKMLTSHDKPVCSALYHSIFKQVVSVCQNGVVTVWDVLSGQATMQFKVTLDQHVGLTAISFDESQRRLITMSQDGKVRLWNFNRRKFLEHDHLDDITSLDVHENTLITASSNGNIIIWDADTAEVLYRINANENPRTIMADKHALGRTGTVAVEKKPKRLIDTKNPQHKKSTTVKTTDSTSPLIKCLRTRVITFSTATLLTSTDGYIYAWSVISKGGLLGKFRAVKDEGAVVTTMSTDVSEQILLTGDSTGRIYLWDIQGFGFKKQTDEGPFENIKGWLEQEDGMRSEEP
uniref:WD repeat-containing protein on Y chromosome n=1 Tax=Seriola dumerili TaxID=41447 RepID=A0A3B4U654_SERDU